ncbi:MAG: hypothetical protein BWY09_02439 [Candidatus Hydrogenedentes bacterium ADurb.Bin179]|nr:MAG: hypothetical protein BWY09_02439 [Candidatus Hydrogenedentes bacterium ADurb.Bin179]
MQQFRRLRAWAFIPDPDQPFTQSQTRFHGIGKTFPGIGVDGKPVYDNVDVMFHVSFHFDIVFHMIKRAVHTDTGVSLLFDVREHLLIVAFALAYQRRHQLHPRALGKGENAVHNALGRLRFNRLAAFMAVGDTCPGKEQAQIIINFGDRADGGTGIAVRCLLLDGNGRTQSLDILHIGLVHLVQELARIGRQALHVTTLSLGINGIESKAGLTRTAQAGNDDQTVTGQFNGKILEIMFAGAAYNDTPAG